jgi:hypothetical protein
MRKEAYKISKGKPERKKSLGRLRRRWRFISKYLLMEYVVRTWGPMAGSCEDGKPNERSSIFVAYYIQDSIFVAYCI